jgi:predicted small metal-binding protein
MQGIKGFKADMSEICGCGIFVVGKTKKDLLSNFTTHMRDVHRARHVAGDIRRKLKQAVEEIR